MLRLYKMLVEVTGTERQKHDGRRNAGMVEAFKEKVVKSQVERSDLVDMRMLAYSIVNESQRMADAEQAGVQALGVPMAAQARTATQFSMATQAPAAIQASTTVAQAPTVVPQPAAAPASAATQAPTEEQALTEPQAITVVTESVRTAQAEQDAVAQSTPQAG